MAHLWLGTLLGQQKDFSGARTEIAASLDILKPLVGEDPTNLDWTSYLSAAHYEFGDLLLAQQDFAGAAEEFGASQQLRQDLSNRQPQSTLYRPALFYADFRLGLSRHEQGNLSSDSQVGTR
jgi:TolA-binding protein